MSKKILAAAVLAAVAAGSAQADVVMFSFDNPLATTEINQTASLGLFDTGLGTLTKVELMLTGQDKMTISLTNTAAQEQDVDATGTVKIRFTSSLTDLNTFLGTKNPIVSLTNPTGLQTLAAGETKSFGPLLDSDSATYASPADLNTAWFGKAGGGTFDLTCRSLSGLSLEGGGGNIDSTQDTMAACGAKITYTYEQRQVPEPVSMLLVGLGLLGIGAARRRQA